jgi:hypothetical protein
MRYLLCLCLTGCATFGQRPPPVGEPGPVACVGAKSALQAWMELDKYMVGVLEAQQTYSCAPVPPATPPPAVPALR